MSYDGYKRKLTSIISFDVKDYIRIKSNNCLTPFKNFGLVL